MHPHDDSAKVDGDLRAPSESIRSMNAPGGRVPPLILSRRDAIKRVAALLGVAISPSIFEGVLNAQPATRSGANAQPAYLTREEFATAAAIAERILPRTDTPGAQDVGVPAFIDLMFGKYMTADEQRTFSAGLAEVDATSTRLHQMIFAHLSAGQQDALLMEIAKASQAKERTFFHQMRELTLLGYFTSEKIGKEVLHYDPVPGRYQGCISLAEVGNKAWTR
jgi:gluconate 2-dehydrogenase gamma chain